MLANSRFASYITITTGPKLPIAPQSRLEEENTDVWGCLTELSVMNETNGRVLRHKQSITLIWRILAVDDLQGPWQRGMPSWHSGRRPIARGLGVLCSLIVLSLPLSLPWSTEDNCCCAFTSLSSCGQASLSIRQSSRWPVMNDTAVCVGRSTTLGRGLAGKGKLAN